MFFSSMFFSVIMASLTTEIEMDRCGILTATKIFGPTVAICKGQICEFLIPGINIADFNNASFRSGAGFATKITNSGSGSVDALIMPMDSPSSESSCNFCDESSARPFIPI